MFFKRIEMHGFKSFAEPVVVEFDKGITCVVGPNGSGKSNISDAIRWVLGEQSPKMLRGGKMEDVIFSGTQRRKSRGMAEVTLVIDNQQGKLPIEYSEVAITRRMYRSGESEYAINNNQCRMRDIRNLLADTGIGVDGYSLIGQGKISEIISNKKESIREVFEESAGIVSYRNRKSEAEKKLEQTKVNMDRACDIIAEIEDRIDGLKEDSQKAQSYMQLKDRYKELEVSLIINNLVELGEKAVVLSQDSKKIGEDLLKLEENKSQLDSEIQKYKEELLDIKNSEKEESQNIEELSETLSCKNNENSIGRERLRAIEHNQLRIKREISQLNEKIGQEKSNLREKLEGSKEGLATLGEKKVLLKEMEDEIDRMKATMEAMVNSQKIKEDRFYQVSSEQAVIENVKGNLLNLLDNLKDNCKEFDLDERVRNLNLILENKAAKEEELQKLKNEILSARQNIEDLNEEINFCHRNKSEKDKLLYNLGLELSKVEARRRTLMEMEEGYEGYQNAVKHIMAKDISGVEGVVADLIKVEKGKELAIEIALGGALQNIVVKDQSAGKRCIDTLKVSKAGRATFLPIDKIKGKNKKKDINHKGFLGYGDQLVSFNSKYKDIFDYLLGGTLVVDNLENAIEISKMETLKLVTLDGDVILSTGAMSGGSQKYKTGNILQRKQEVLSLVEEIEGLKKKIEALNKEIDQLSENNKTLSEEKIEKEKYLELMKEKERFVHQETLELNSKVNLVQEDMEREKQALEARADDLVRVERDLGHAEEKSVSLEKELMKLTKDMESAKEDISKFALDFEEKSKSLIDFRLDFAKESQNVAGIKNLLDIIESNIKTLEEEIDFKGNQLLNLDADKEGVSKGIRLRSQEIAKLAIEKDRLVRNKKEKDIKLESLNKSLEEAAIIREEALSKISMLQSQKYEIDLRLAKADTQEKTLRDRLWEEWEMSYAEAMAMKKLEMSQAAIIKENKDIKNKIKALGDINLGAIKEYEEVRTRYEFLTVERDDIQSSLDQLKSIISNMDREIKKKFKESFDSIAFNFENIFKEFFGGGQGKIEIDDIDDPLNATIEIIAQPPGKQLKNINLLSGGEKTMTAIALMFAVLKTKPTPCCILDEVEAALDDNNIHIFANYLKKFEDVQFTLITHQKATMEHADVMYGITMPERGVSKIFSLKMGDQLPV